MKLTKKFRPLNAIYKYFILSDIARAIELLDKLQMSGEVPATKLAALQKVLQSDFLNGEIFGCNILEFNLNNHIL